MGATYHNNSEETAPWFTRAGMTDRLIALHGEGIGYTAIARILADEYDLPVTKNQVVGKARRMDLARRKPIGLQPKLPIHKLEKAQPPKPRNRKPHAPLQRLSDGRPGSPRPSVPLPPPTPTILLLPPLLPASTLPREALRCESLPIVTLNPNQCKFAYGEYPYQFCGRPQVEGLAYCAGHLAIMFCTKWSRHG